MSNKKPNHCGLGSFSHQNEERKISFATFSRRTAQSTFVLIGAALHRLTPIMSVLIVEQNELATRSIARGTLSSTGQQPNCPPTLSTITFIS
ncbi:hypothetical protein VMB_06920 [Vibrio mimicus VM603]|uniref:Uncharacterized protein n=1 Tax=Vibrio mimicus VM603 TaxID=671074 RepID=D2YAZ5_VIBMI|nr:hypothetical protein VMB_06920 [Vibrio mimicus VM603]